MSYQKLLVSLYTTTGAVWDVFKALIATSFAMNPHHGFVLIALYVLDVVMGRIAAMRQGVRIPWRVYARERAYRLVELGCWLAVVLLITNMSPSLQGVQAWALIGTATLLGGGIVTHHLSGEWQAIWLEVKGKIISRSERHIQTPPGAPDVTEHTIVTVHPPSEDK